MKNTEIEARISEKAKTVLAVLTVAEIVASGENAGRIKYVAVAGHSAALKAGKYNAELTEIKAAILAIKAEQDAAFAEYERKLNAIEGLKEMNTLANAWDAYAVRRERAMDNGAQWPTAPKTEMSELAAKFPRAAAYRKANAWSMASNYIKAGCGRRATEQVLNGEDYAAALADMDREWSDYCEAHIND